MTGAMVSILARDVVPAAPLISRPVMSADLVGPSPNSDGKRDRLPVIRGSAESNGDAVEPAAPEPLRQAFASDSPLMVPEANLGPDIGLALTSPVPLPRERGRPGRPAIQKNYTLLSDMQIAAIKGRLRLTAAQEAYWPQIEAALRAVAKSMHDKRQANPAAGAPTIDPASAEVEQLKTAAMPLLGELREDQKREVRSLARLIGLEAVASQI